MRRPFRIISKTLPMALDWLILVSRHNPKYFNRYLRNRIINVETTRLILTFGYELGKNSKK